ncbi:MAG: type II 3-dehydroquinate dehydratase [Actinobacteria bacterium]|nr:type II 3-dehydroquinate dehydratase [Actinomycetota bacterium]
MIAVLNGANLNMLGRRDLTQYGSLTLSELESRVYAWAGEINLTARCFQTNHEGALIDHIHEAAGWATGMIVNPGAWTHYSYAIRDALEIVAAPVVEVHLSDIATREEWRRQSVIRDVVDHAIAGEGPDGYRLALEWLRGTLAHG